MDDKAEFFKQHHYVYLEDVSNQRECEDALKLIFQSEQIDGPSCSNDGQCPLSSAFYGLFDYLLLNKKEVFEDALKMRLYPTYSYARIYKPDEKLGFHLDRDACEITATINVGFLGEKTWPIYILPILESNEHRNAFLEHNKGMSPDQTYHNNYVDGKEFKTKVKTDLAIGDAVVFKGRELFHWRESYIEGAWQVQIFLHYVNADGPFKDLKYDGRERLQL